MLRRIFFVVVAAVTAACANGNGEQVDPCERFIKRLADECGWQPVDLEAVELHCTGQAACVAVCYEQSPCEDISNNSGQFSDCMADCE
jgi:hypothetical protein